LKSSCCGGWVNIKQNGLIKITSAGSLRRKGS